MLQPYSLQQALRKSILEQQIHQKRQKRDPVPAERTKIGRGKTDNASKQEYQQKKSKCNSSIFTFAFLNKEATANPVSSSSSRFSNPTSIYNGSQASPINGR